MILCCGEALIDMLPRETTKGEQAFAPYAGGSVFNTAIALGRLGAPTGFLSGISTDLFGQILDETLAASKVDASLAIRSNRPTTLAFVTLTDGHAQYAFYDENTAGRMISVDDLPADSRSRGSDVLRRHLAAARPLRRDLRKPDAARGGGAGDDDRPQHPPQLHHRRTRLPCPDRPDDGGGDHRQILRRRPRLAGNAAGRSAGGGVEARLPHRGLQGRDGALVGRQLLRRREEGRGGRYGRRGRYLQRRAPCRAAPGRAADAGGALGHHRGGAHPGAGARRGRRGGHREPRGRQPALGARTGFRA